MRSSIQKEKNHKRIFLPDRELLNGRFEIDMIVEKDARGVDFDTQRLIVGPADGRPECHSFTLRREKRKELSRKQEDSPFFTIQILHSEGIERLLLAKTPHHQILLLFGFCIG